METIKSLMAHLFLIAIAFIPEPRPEKKPELMKERDISGVYQCIGQEKEKYQGLVQVEKVGQIYVVQWSFAGTIFVGAGMKHENSLVVGWSTDKKRGVSVFDWNTLEGSWTSIPGNGQKNPEKWHRVVLPVKDFKE